MPKPPCCVLCCPVWLSPTHAHLLASPAPHREWPPKLPSASCVSSSLFIHSLIHSFGQGAIARGWAPSMHWACHASWTRAAAGHSSPRLPWQDLSLLVSESDVRLIPSDKVSPRRQLPVSSYLLQSISTRLSILMAYGSRGESPNERKLATVLIGLKKTTGGGSFL